jgi:hypothetical protein
MAEAVALPVPAGAASKAHCAVTREACSGHLQSILDDGAGSCGSDEHEARLVADAAQAEVASDQRRRRHPSEPDGQGDLGLWGVGDANQTQGQTAPGEVSAGLDAVLDIRQEVRLDDGLLRPGADAQGGLGDHAQTSLTAHDQLTEIRPGGRGRQGGERHPVLRSDQFQAGHHVLDPAVPRTLLTRRPGGDPAAHCGEFPGLGEVPQGQIVGRQDLLDLRAGGAGSEDRQTADFIQRHQPAHVFQVQGDDRTPVIGWVHPAP